MKLLKMTLGLAVFILAAFGVIKYFFLSHNEIEEKNGVYLNNNVEFDGIVSELKVSNNHRFGIITLNITQHDLSVFNQGSLTNKNMIFPYKIQNGIAEVYDLVPSGLSVGDSVYINSKRVIKYFYVKENKQFTGEVKMITNNLDIDFVNQNSKVK